ncbi:MAG: transglycosylase domain-containing protein [Clostridia bacterium]|nr:transglycosylase domain-containing protein [Clostridia bacterium]
MKNLFKIIRKIILFIIVMLLLIVACFVATGYSMYQKALEEKPIDKMIEEIKSKENYTKLEEMPKIYIDAVIAVEDHRFYDHRGVDYFAIVGAIINDLSNQSLIQGGSTITQQICKNVYFTQERKLERKIAETFMAAELEYHCDKDDILELYINTCFYGNNCYTPKEASKLYFEKEPSEMNDYESTLLAGVPNAPSLYNPIYSMKLAKERQAQVLYAMIKYNYINEEQKEAILAQGENSNDN